MDSENVCKNTYNITTTYYKSITISHSYIYTNNLRHAKTQIRRHAGDCKYPVNNIYKL